MCENTKSNPASGRKSRPPSVSAQLDVRKSLAGVARAGDHRRGKVHPHDARDAAGQRPEEPSDAAPDLEHAPPGRDVEAVERRAPRGRALPRRRTPRESPRPWCTRRTARSRAPAGPSPRASRPGGATAARGATAKRGRLSSGGRRRGQRGRLRPRRVSPPRGGLRRESRAASTGGGSRALPAAERGRERGRLRRSGASRRAGRSHRSPSSPRRRSGWWPRARKSPRERTRGRRPC